MDSFFSSFVCEVRSDNLKRKSINQLTQKVLTPRRGQHCTNDDDDDDDDDVLWKVVVLWHTVVILGV